MRLAGKVARLRIFENDDGVSTARCSTTGGAASWSSQFTLIADTAKGNRPSFAAAAPPGEAEPLYERFCEALGALGVPVERGSFGARMAVELVNDGPVTIVLDSELRRRSGWRSPPPACTRAGTCSSRARATCRPRPPSRSSLASCVARPSPR